MGVIALKFFKIGSRTLKTGIAVSLSIAIAHALNAEPAVFAAVSAIVNLQPTVYQSYINALQQIGITIIGIIVGLSLALTFGNSAIIVGVSSVIVILIALRLGWNSVILIGIVTIIFIIDTQEVLFFEHAFSRISVIFIGLLVAMAVNVVLAPSDYRKFTLDKLSQFHTDVTTLFYRRISGFINMQSSAQEDNDLLNQLHDEIDTLRKSLDIYKQEVRVLPYSTQAKELQVRSDLLEELYRYDVQLLHKLLLIKDFEQDRLSRLAARNVKTYTETFQHIIDTIHVANERILDNSRILNDGIIAGVLPSSDWVKVDMSEKALEKKIDAWHDEHGDESYYMSALMELSIVIYEMRWIAREQNRLYEKYKGSHKQSKQY